MTSVSFLGLVVNILSVHLFSLSLFVNFVRVEQQVGFSGGRRALLHLAF